MFSGLHWYQWLALAALLDLAVAISYGLARAGEPSSAWLWGMMQHVTGACGCGPPGSRLCQSSSSLPM